MSFEFGFQKSLAPSLRESFVASDVGNDVLSFGPSDVLSDATSSGLSFRLSSEVSS